jgi:hypothetical protein
MPMHSPDLIDFRALAERLLSDAETWVKRWLPGGKRSGKEWVCGSLAGEEGGSLSVNLKSGVWKDFDAGAGGSDLISLYAAVEDLPMAEAARALIQQLGGGQMPPPRPVQAPAAPTKRPPENWASMWPVPHFAPPPTFRHQYRQVADITHKAEYRLDGQVLGYVVRFRTSDGGKETLPYTWCSSVATGTARWHWRQWDEPRPLYVPGGRSIKEVQGERLEPPTVIVVEGERKAEVLQALLDAAAPGVYVVVSWPGGCKAWNKALWDWVAGCTVLLWPDCDAKREPLTVAERKANPDPVARELLQLAKPLLAKSKQPGLLAMVGLGRMLRDQHGCEVQLLPIPEPATVVDGWDAADAIETDGWDYAAVQALFARAGPLPSDDVDEAPGAPASGPVGPVQKGAGGGSAPPSGDGNGGGGAAEPEDEFASYLEWLANQQDCEVWQLGVNRKLVIKALRVAPGLHGCLGFNELSGGAGTRKAWPWREQATPLENSDDLRLGDYLSAVYKLKPASRAALQEAIDTVADENRFHPIRDWLTGLQHDGKGRIDKWLIHVLGSDPERLSPTREEYLAKVGRYVLLGLVARVMDPGCKYDYSMVLEGPPGRMKSTMIKTLVGKAFFSDTHFDIGAGKEGFEQLEGLWGYELSEMTALRKADSEQVKQFFSSQVDRFRGAYGRYVQAHPRQCVIFCSTNKQQYLYDLTGNRRFWPVRVHGLLRVEWLAKWREQLFAEALALYRARERIYPTPEDEERLFKPEQDKRLVETAVQARMYELLTREGSGVHEAKISKELSQHTAFVTLDQLVQALGADAAKSTPMLEQQVKGWLEWRGWKSGRESTGQRRRGFKRPEQWPPEVAADDDWDDEAGEQPATGAATPPDVGADAVGGTDGAPY